MFAMTIHFVFFEGQNELLNIIRLISGSKMLLHQQITLRSVRTNFNMIISD
jgi:hypothetical protein